MMPVLRARAFSARMAQFDATYKIEDWSNLDGVNQFMPVAMIPERK